MFSNCFELRLCEMSWSIIKSAIQIKCIIIITIIINPAVCSWMYSEDWIQCQSSVLLPNLHSGHSQHCSNDSPVVEKAFSSIGHRCKRNVSIKTLSILNQNQSLIRIMVWPPINNNTITG